MLHLRPLCLALLLLAACSKPTSKPAPAPAPAPPSSLPAPAPSESLPFGDAAHVFVPTERDANVRLPFVLALHGLGGGGEELVRGLGLNDFAQRERFLFAAPDGNVDLHGRRFWDAGPVCCNFEQAHVDEVARLGALIDYAVASLGADPARIFVVGYSNGGFMAHRLACERSRTLNAIVSIAAAGPREGETCAAESPVNVLELHGDADAIVPFEGGHLFKQASMPTSANVLRGLDVWARRDACEGEIGVVAKRDLIDELPGAETQIQRFARCGRAQVELWRVVGGGHALNLRPHLLDAIWQFLRALPAKAR